MITKLVIQTEEIILVLSHPLMGHISEQIILCDWYDERRVNFLKITGDTIEGSH